MKKLQLFTEYFGLLGTDAEGTNIFGFENISQKRTEQSFSISGGGVYGFVNKGSITIVDGEETFQIPKGHWFSTVDGVEINFQENDYQVAIWQVEKYKGMFAMGKVEDFGRLKYIDGCKDTMLSHPIKKGNPCLNALYMPDGVHQTMHTHPSTRSGFIFVGGATCTTPEGTVDLESGQIFFLPSEVEHKFRSDHQKDVVMKLVAFHPDSDFGATDQNHPMINRTIVDGISANSINEIQTK